MTAPYTLETAPASIAPPARDEAGRAIRHRTGGVICPAGHGDAELRFYRSRRQHGAQTGSWVCRMCRNIEQSRRNRIRRAKPAAPPPVVEAQAVCWTPRHPFDYTRVQLEAAWGPYRAWTREQHLQHTQLLYDFLGWGPDAARRPVLAGKPDAAMPEVAA